MNDQQKIQLTIDHYFKGIFCGDVDLLRSAFDPRANLFAEIKGQPYYKPLDEYLNGVADRRSPQELNEPFLMKTLSIEVLGNIAFAKLHCPMLGFNYYDYLSFIQHEGRWLIVNKLFTHIAV